MGSRAKVLFAAFLATLVMVGGGVAYGYSTSDSTSTIGTTALTATYQMVTRTFDFGGDYPDDNISNWITIPCPANYNVVGGGGYYNVNYLDQNEDRMPLAGSRPNSTGTGWEIRGSVLTVDSSATAVGYAICVNGLV